MGFNKHIVNKRRLLIDQIRVRTSALFLPNGMTSSELPSLFASQCSSLPNGDPGSILTSCGNGHSNLHKVLNILLGILQGLSKLALVSSSFPLFSALLTPHPPVSDCLELSSLFFRT